MPCTGKRSEMLAAMMIASEPIVAHLRRSGRHIDHSQLLGSNEK